MHVAGNLLVDLDIAVMSVHSADIIKQIFLEDLPEFLILDVEETEQKLDSLDRIQNILGPEDHDTSHTLLADVGMQVGSMVFQQVDHLGGNER